jgi:subtilase family serine protease
VAGGAPRYCDGIRTRVLITLLTTAVLLAGTTTGVAASSPPAVPAAVAGDAPIDVTLALRPRHPALLRRLAAASSARPPLPAATVRALFLPTPGQVATVRAAMLSKGLRFQAQRALSLTFTGTAAAADRAFGVTLQVARRADGSLARRPSAVPRAPAAVAPLIQDIEGLDTRVQLHPAGGPASGTAEAPPCNGARATAGYLPAQLGSARGYGFSSLIAGGWDGSGESVAMVEFSNYNPADVATYQACYGTEVPVSTVTVGAGTTTRSGSDEAELDIETAITAAPGLDGVKVYVAKPNGTMSSVVNAIVADAPSTGVRIISDSWGLCEPALSPARVAATDSALQLAAVSGITFLAASGDSGSYDCTGFRVLAVDDPAAQQFATAVGGSDLQLNATGSRREVVWNDVFGAGGGGLSRFWSRPSWQTGAGTTNQFSTGARQLPDISLHASPAQHGYPIYCTTAVCGGAGWTTVGGTSASAPLLAGIVADMNSYSRAHGGQRLGYADPFLYDRFGADPAAFRDVTRGDNNPIAPGRYPATAGYDLASGIGTPDAAALAVDLAGYVPVAPSPAVTQLTALPARDQVVRYGHSVVLHGRLSDAGGGIAGARLVVQGGDLFGIREWRVRTDASGRWTLTLARQLVRKTRWRAVYLGTLQRRPAVSPRRTLFIVPPLSARVSTHALPAGQPLRLSGLTLAVLQGRPVAAEVRRGHGHWRRLGPAGVGLNGNFRRTVSLGRPGRYQLRWHYHGSRNGQWLTAYSPRRSVVVT